MAGHQPKELTELAFASFTAYMRDKALQLLNWMEDSPTSTDEATETCRKLKDFFHGTRLPRVLANEITKRLLIKLDIFSVIYKSTRRDYFQQILLPLVEVFLHPDVTSIELGPGYLYKSGYDYCNFIVSLILMKLTSLRNLKTLSVELGINTNLVNFKLVLPSQLKELTLCGTLCLHKNSLKSIAECCRELKALKIVRWCNADTSVPYILELNHLETLHLLGEHIYGLDAVCVALVNGISTDVLSDVLSAPTLKSFGIELTDENTLHLIVNKLPHLTEIVLELPCEVDLSCLTQLKNLRSLTLDAEDRASDDYKKILPVLGKSLVSLELQCYETLDFEFIGETCSNLRCLHVNTTACYPVACQKPSLKNFPNFRTVECLIVDRFWDYDWVEFIIVQCVNVKVLRVVHSGQHNIIGNVLKRTSLTSLEEIHWYPPLRNDKSCLEELCLRCPNLGLVHGLGSDSFISRKVLFNFRGCYKTFCESFCYVLETVKYLCDSPSVSENSYTSDSDIL